MDGTQRVGSERRTGRITISRWGVVTVPRRHGRGPGRSPGKEPWPSRENRGNRGMNRYERGDAEHGRSDPGRQRDGREGEQQVWTSRPRGSRRYGRSSRNEKGLTDDEKRLGLTSVQ